MLICRIFFETQFSCSLILTFFSRSKLQEVQSRLVFFQNPWFSVGVVAGNAVSCFMGTKRIFQNDTWSVASLSTLFFWRYQDVFCIIWFCRKLQWTLILQNMSHSPTKPFPSPTRHCKLPLEKWGIEVLGIEEKLPEFSGILKFFLWGMPRLISLVFLVVLLAWIVEVEVWRCSALFCFVVLMEYGFCNISRCNLLWKYHHNYHHYHHQHHYQS